MHCYTSFESSSYGSQKANLPQIFKDLQEKVYKTPVGMKVKALRASKA
jgi:hypothetical protein